MEREYSPRLKMLLFFFYFLLTFAAVRLWMYVIETDNVYYETAAAFATMLVISSLYFYYSRLAARHRQHFEEIRSGGAGSQEIDPADLEAAHLRLQLRRMFGDNLDIILQGGPGLSAEMIHRLLRQFTYESLGVRETTCVKVEAADGTDLEAGLMDRAETGRTSKVQFAEECAVCLCDFADGDMLTELPCGHVYHRTCITAWLQNRNLCPLCKKVAVQMTDLAAALPQALADPLPPSAPPSPSSLPPPPMIVAPMPLQTAALQGGAGDGLRAPRPTMPPRWRSYSGPVSPVGNLFGTPSGVFRSSVAASQPGAGAVTLESIEDLESPRSDHSDPSAMTIGAGPVDGTSLPVPPPATVQTGGSEPSSGQPPGPVPAEAAEAGRDDGAGSETYRPGLAGYRALSLNDISDLNSVEGD